MKQVLLRIRPEARDAVVEGCTEVDALVVSAVGGGAASREPGVDANEANAECESVCGSEGRVRTRSL
jgi:hypothetical protein